MDYISGKGSIDTAAAAMAEDIRSAISSGELSGPEIVKLQSALTDIVGDADLASAYVNGEATGVNRNSSYSRYLKMLDEVDAANKSGMSAREFSESKGVPSTLSDEDAELLDKYDYRMESEGEGEEPETTEDGDTLNVDETGENGYNQENGVKKTSEAVSYERPSKFRKGKRKETWRLAVEESEDGIVKSPSGKEITEDDKWQMGHKPGYQFWKHKVSAERRGISRKEFLDEYNIPKHYRPELPEDNFSHKYEGPEGLNYWDDID